VRITGTRAFNNAPGMNAILDALHANASTTPTHWGIEERDKTVYARDDFLEAFVAADCNWSQLFFSRGKAPRFNARMAPSWSAVETGTVTVEFGKVAAKHLPVLFALGTHLAEALHVAYGGVHPVFPLEADQKDYLDALRGMNEVDDFGPGTPAARTWYGPHILGLAPSDAFDGLFANTTTLSTGALEADLVAEPWAAGLEELLSLQRKALPALATTGVFGDYATLHRRRAPTPKWTPIPLDSA
jgi:hypothetical protein